MKEDYYVILAGGVGAAKFIEGLKHVLNPKSLKIIINTGDDIDLFGLKICPDLDIITYTMANLVDKEKGWGFTGESFNCLSVLFKYYGFNWFNAGDKDLATHIYRTDLFQRGFSKAEITQKICEKLGIQAELIPMCNEPVQTFIRTTETVMHFEEYFIKHQCKPVVLDVEFRGMENATPVENVIKYIHEAKRVIICPSNPIVSIGTILKVKGMRQALIEVREKVIGITPIIQGAAVKGPADKLMECLGLEVSCEGVARYYEDFMGSFVIDEKDSDFKSDIERLNIKTYCFDTLMTDLQKKINLAKFIMEI